MVTLLGYLVPSNTMEPWLNKYTLQQCAESTALHSGKHFKSDFFPFYASLNFIIWTMFWTSKF